ncbi:MULTISPECIES: hypothetical protein [Enterobacteriaceae]|uniref:hypothetical protein n=1 Tax=Enterobacteriaceae TaxID=543 RepID=UPI000CDD6A2F|nr:MULTISPECIES: hypothetical protein [Enterobacteriaceae]POT98470.1 hypothetical protein C3369_18610 [Escherichia sp. ESNIH1]
MKRVKSRTVILLIALVALLAWWLVPHYSDEDKAWYASVLCTVKSSSPAAGLTEMEQMIEGGNSDYALKKTHFSPSLGKKMLHAWEQLSDTEKQQAMETPKGCAGPLLAKMGD